MRREARPHAARPAHSPRPVALHDAANFAVRAGTLGVLVISAVVLGGQARRGWFATDECFHAYVSEWILAHHRLPTVMSEFYSGFYYYYQPLLHMLGAAWSELFGLAALHVLPVALTVAGPVALLALARRAVPEVARCWAVLLCALNASLASFGVRLYVESLITLLFIVAVALLIEFHRAGRARYAVALGVVIGLALLTKFSGWLLAGFVGLVALVEALRRDGARSRSLALALLIAVGLVAPWLIRNQSLFGSPVYPAFAPDMDRALYALNRHRFSMPAPVFLRGIPVVLGPWLTGLALVAVARAAWTQRATIREGLLLFSIAGMCVTAWTPMAAARHLNPFIPVLALASAWSLADALEARPWMRHAVSAVLIVAAIGWWAAAHDYRADADVPENLREAFKAIVPRVPRGETILSLWTYDTFYYTRRNATWPNPWGQRAHPIELFRETDPARFLADLDRYGIDDLLVPRTARPVAFDSANYPESFMRCVGELVRGGALRVEWESESLALLRRVVAKP